LIAGYVMSRKCFVCHLLNMLQLSPDGLELFGKPIEFVWVQGIVTNLSVELQQMSVDDGTGCIAVISGPEKLSEFTELKVGDYVLLQGSVSKGEDEVSGVEMVVLEARIVSPIKNPNMETLWMLEVLEGIARSCL